MDIERFDFFPTHSPEVATTVGINIQKKFGLTTVNLFALKENKGAPIATNIWGIANAISKEVLLGERIDDLNWTLTSRSGTSALKFSTINGQPYKLDISDKTVFSHEEYDFNRLPLETYIAESKKSRRFEIDGRPETIFCVPCAHPEAKDGVFYCRPAFYEADHMRDDYEFILADTRKIVELLKKDAPDMLEHSARNLKGGSSAEEWLRSTEIDYPRDMGHWTYSREFGLNFSSGQAALIKVADNLNLPYFPIAIAKASGGRNIEELKEKVAYGFIRGRHEPNMQPTYTPGF